MCAAFLDANVCSGKLRRLKYVQALPHPQGANLSSANRPAPMQELEPPKGSRFRLCTSPLMHVIYADI